MLQVLIDIFWLIKIRKRSFGISYYNHTFFHDYQMIRLFKLIKWLDQIIVNFFIDFITLIQKIYLISFFNLYELYPDFVCANTARGLANNLGVKNPVPNIFLLRRLNSIFSVIAPSGLNFTSSLSSYDEIGDKSSKYWW